MTTYAIYQDTPNGRLRVGTFRGPRGSVRMVSAEFYRRNPNAQGSYLIATRWLVNGTWTDAEPVPMEPKQQ